MVVAVVVLEVFYFVVVVMVLILVEELEPTPNTFFHNPLSFYEPLRTESKQKLAESHVPYKESQSIPNLIIFTTTPYPL